MKVLRSLVAVSISLALTALSPGYGCYRAMAQVVGANVTVGAGQAMGQVGAVGAVSPVRLNLMGPGSAGIAPSLGSSALPGTLTPDVRVGPSQSLTSVGAPAASPAVSRARQSALTGGLAASPAAAARTAETDRSAGIGSYRVLEAYIRAKLYQMSNKMTKEAADKKKAEEKEEKDPAAKSKSRSSALGGLMRELPDFGKVSQNEAKALAHSDFMSRIGAYQSRGSGIVSAVSRTGAMRSVSGLKKSGSKRSSARTRKDMPPVERASEDPMDTSDLDELGNPRRTQSEGPDSVYDEFGGDGGRSNSDLFSVLGPVLTAAAFAGAVGLSGFAANLLPMLGAFFGIIIPSIILHEMGHGKAALMLGDSTAKDQGRLSFRSKDLLPHFDLMGTVILPLGLMIVNALGIPMFLFGWAKPVRVNPENLKDPVKDMAKVALAGPAVNFALAVVTAHLHALALMMGAPGLVVSALILGTYFNMLLGVFNLIPLFPLDGHHVLRHVLTNWFKAPKLADSMDRIGILPLILFFAFGFKYVMAYVVIPATQLLLAGPLVIIGGVGVQMATAALPALAALGLLAGIIKHGGFTPGGGEKSGTVTPQYMDETPGSVDLIVVFDGSQRPMSEDIHLSLVDVGGRFGMQRYQAAQSVMNDQLALAGVGYNILSAYGATPIATYKRINAATLRVPESQAMAFRSAMESRGFRVFDNERREIIKPIEDDPAFRGQSMPQAGAVTMQETLKISSMDKVHEEARLRWGPPAAGNLRTRILLRLLSFFGVNIPQPPGGVIDTGVEKEHQLIEPGLKEAKDVRPNGDGKDDNGHGSWTQSMVAWFAPWLKHSITHYKTFMGGGATLDDILKALTMAGNDGNIVISNSWGSSYGNPESPDSLLVKKLAEEGHIMVFSAGNSGPRKNTIGSPAIVHYRDAETGAPRVLAVAATDRGKKVVYFSSRGEHSYYVERNAERFPDYPKRPDVAEQGYNTEGAWPSYKSGGRVDPVLGKVRAISGTSMSAPKFAGTILMLASLFGVTKTGKELDRIVNAVMSSLTNEHGQKDWEVGGGFNAAYAAYQKLKAQGFMPIRSNFIVRALLWLLDWSSGDKGIAGAGKVSSEIRAEYKALKTVKADLMGQVHSAVQDRAHGWNMTRTPTPVWKGQKDGEIARLWDEIGEYGRKIQALEAEHPGLLGLDKTPKAFKDARSEYRKLKRRKSSLEAMAKRNDQLPLLRGDLEQLSRLEEQIDALETASPGLRGRGLETSGRAPRNIRAEYRALQNQKVVLLSGSFQELPGRNFGTHMDGGLRGGLLVRDPTLGLENIEKRLAQLEELYPGLKG